MQQVLEKMQIVTSNNNLCQIFMANSNLCQLYKGTKDFMPFNFCLLNTRKEQLYVKQCEIVNAMIKNAKTTYYSSVISNNAHNPNVLFNTVDKLLH